MQSLRRVVRHNTRRAAAARSRPTPHPALGYHPLSLLWIARPGANLRTPTASTPPPIALGAAEEFQTRTTHPHHNMRTRPTSKIKPTPQDHPPSRPRRSTLADARKRLRPGDTIKLESYYAGALRGYCARADHCGQAWVTGHTSPISATQSLAVKILYGNPALWTPARAVLVLGALAHRKDGSATLTIPLGWQASDADQPQLSSQA